MEVAMINLKKIKIKLNEINDKFENIDDDIFFLILSLLLVLMPFIISILIMFGIIDDVGYHDK
jgi:hypothetical protein